jgi:SAM-dependent methyltransferase
MIHEARTRNRYPWPRLRFHLGDVHCLDLDSNSFDGCLVISTFMHLEHPVKALKEMVRVLKKGGRLVALEPDWDTLVMTAGNTAVSSIIVTKIRQSVHHSGIAHELPALFRKAGLSPIGVEAGTTLATDYSLASDVWRIEENVNCTSCTTAVKTHKNNELLRQLKKANKNKEFFMASTSFAVHGIKK